MGLALPPTNGSSGNSIILLENIEVVKGLVVWVGVDYLRTMIDLLGKRWGLMIL